MTNDHSKPESPEKYRAYRKAIAAAFYASLEMGISSNSRIALTASKIDTALADLCGYEELSRIIDEFPQEHFSVLLMGKSE